MKKVVQLADYRSSNNFPGLTEVQTLYARIETDCDDIAIQKIERLKEQKRIRSITGKPLEVKRKFALAFRCFCEVSNKPVDEDCVTNIRSFFAAAALSKYQTTQELSDFLGEGITPNIITSMAFGAKSQKHSNERARQIGRAKRERRTNSPSQGLRAVGQAPR